VKAETILAPLAGWSSPLGEIPDEVFARAMMGEGAAIDPLTSELRAPSDGEIISIANARHAVALRTPAGAEILLHVGIDTVSLGGDGFEVHVEAGQRVRAGDLLLSFDLDRVSRRAPSLITPVIVTNGERFRIRNARLDRKLQSGEILFELEAVADAVPAAAPGESPAAAGSSRRAPVLSETVIVTHAQGIHARPAARIARLAKALPHDIEVRARGRGASARSAVALMSLGIRGGDELVLAAFDAAAADSLASIADLVRGIEDMPEPKVQGSSKDAGATPANDPLEPGTLRGVVASRGFATGSAFFMHHVDVPVAEIGLGFEQESAAFDRSRAEVRARLTRRVATAAPAAREILSAHLELLDDPELLQEARAAIGQGKSAGFAWRSALRASAAALLATGDSRIGERVDDLRDLEQQVLIALGAAAVVRMDPPPGAILLARDLAPSQFIDLDAQRLGGIALAAGGPTSHVAILAAAAGVPMLVALGPALFEVPSGTPLVLDADAGRLHVTPDSAQIDAARRRVDDLTAAAERARVRAQGECRLASGERIEVFANLSGSLADAERAVAQGAEGCGLLRTEFLFLERGAAPDEAEQLACYQQVADVLRGKPLVIRTLDIGGDKPIPYLPLPHEENPALGLRGIRASLWRPDLFDAQLRAMLRVSPAGPCHILLPMITEPRELRDVRARLDSLRASLGVPMPRLGAMIETPASAMLADSLAREADFLSIGTNDLTQYTLAMDRGHAELAPRIDGLHPAVLALIQRVGDAGARHGKLVAVCGGLASDPVAAPVLLGLGVRELSVVPAQIPELKARLAPMTLDECRALAARALTLDSAEDVRRFLRGALT
jgi:phosphoenolpyruvate-protein phosphotransferase